MRCERGVLSYPVEKEIPVRAGTGSSSVRHGPREAELPLLSRRKHLARIGWEMDASILSDEHAVPCGFTGTFAPSAARPVRRDSTRTSISWSTWRRTSEGRGAGGGTCLFPAHSVRAGASAGTTAGRWRRPVRAQLIAAETADARVKIHRGSSIHHRNSLRGHAFSHSPHPVQASAFSCGFGLTRLSVHRFKPAGAAVHSSSGLP